MKNLWFVNSCCFLLMIFSFSCSRPSFKKVSEEDMYDKSIQTDFFAADSTIFFKTSIDTYGKSLSGILALKKQHPDTLKVSFFTEVGVKFFDALVYHDSYTLIDCIPQLDKPVIMNTIVEDIRWIACWNVDKLKNPVQMKSDKNEILVRYNYREDWIFAELSQEQLPIRVTYAYGKKFKSKFEVSYQAYQKGVPAQVEVKHYNFDLKMHLSSVSFNE